MVYLGVTAVLTAGGMVLCPEGASRVRTAWYLAGTFLILFLLSALRAPSVGTDLPTYLQQFQAAGAPLATMLHASRFEWGYLLFSKWIYILSANRVWFTTVTSGCILLPVALFVYRYSRLPWLSVCLFSNLLFFAMSMTAIRQYFALAILLCGLPLLRKNRLLFCLPVLAASCFHVSALLFLLVPLFYSVSFTRRTVLLLLAVGTGAFCFAGEVIRLAATVFPRYALYTVSTYSHGLRPFSFVKLALFGLILIFAWASGYDCQLTREHKPHIELLCGSLALLLALLEIQATVFDRAEDYFAIFFILLLPNILADIRAKQTRMLGIWMALAGSFAYALVTLLFRSDWYHVTSYAFFFS